MSCIPVDKLNEIRGMAEKIIVMSEEGVFDCTDEKCLLLYSVVRDSAYEIKSVLERNGLSTGTQNQGRKIKDV